MSRGTAGGAALATLLAAAATGCGSRSPAAGISAARTTPSAAGTAQPRSVAGVGLHVGALARRCPRRCSFPASRAWGRRSSPSAASDAADTLGGRRRARGARGAAARRRAARGDSTTWAPPRSGSSLYVFGGGSAAGPTDAITRGHARRAHAACRAPAGGDVGHDGGDAWARPPTSSAATRRPRRCAPCWRSGPGMRRARSPPSPTRCATRRPPRSAGACSSRAAPTARTRARRDPQRRPRAPSRARHRPPAGAAGARGRRGARRTSSTSSAGAATRPTSQRRGIWAIDPRDRTCAPRGPAADGALGPRRRAAAGDRLLVAGGRDAHARRAPRAAGARRAPAPAARVAPRRAPRPSTSTPPTRPGTWRRRSAATPRASTSPTRSPNTVDVIDQRTAKIVDHFAVGALPQHVTPVLGPAHAVGDQRHRQQPHPDRPAHRPSRPPGAASPTPTTCTSPPTGAARSSSPRPTASSTSASRTRCASSRRCTCRRAPASTTWTSPPTGASRSSPASSPGGWSSSTCGASAWSRRIDLTAGRDAPGRQALTRRAHVLRRRHGLQRRLADRRATHAQGALPAHRPRRARPLPQPRLEGALRLQPRRRARSR